MQGDRFSDFIILQSRPLIAFSQIMRVTRGSAGLTKSGRQLVLCLLYFVLSTTICPDRLFTGFIKDVLGVGFKSLQSVFDVLQLQTPILVSASKDRMLVES